MVKIRGRFRGRIKERIQFSFKLKDRKTSGCVSESR